MKNNSTGLGMVVLRYDYSNVESYKQNVLDKYNSMGINVTFETSDIDGKQIYYAHVTDNGNSGYELLIPTVNNYILQMAIIGYGKDKSLSLGVQIANNITID